MSSFSGLWDGHYGTPHDLHDKDNSNQYVTRLIGKDRNQRERKALMNALVGSAAGGTAQDSFVRTKGHSALTDHVKFGGVIEMETVTVINRATTAQDVTNIKHVLNDSFQPDTYAPDKSGVGGGGKLSEGM